MRRQTVAAYAVTLATALALIPGHPADALGQARFAADSELRDTVLLYAADRAAVLRRYEVEYSAVRRARMGAFYDDWSERLGRIDFDALSPEGRVDYALLDHELRYERAVLGRRGGESRQT